MFKMEFYFGTRLIFEFFIENKNLYINILFSLKKFCILIIIDYL